MMPLFIYVYDIMGQVSEKIGPVKDEECKSMALNKLDEMNKRAEKEHTLFGVTIKDEKGVDHWKEIVA
jgi:hypothetical protein